MKQSTIKTGEINSNKVEGKADLENFFAYLKTNSDKIATSFEILPSDIIVGDRGKVEGNIVLFEGAPAFDNVEFGRNYKGSDKMREKILPTVKCYLNHKGESLEASCTFGGTEQDARLLSKLCDENSSRTFEFIITRGSEKTSTNGTVFRPLYVSVNL